MRKAAFLAVMLAAVAGPARRECTAPQSPGTERSGAATLPAEVPGDWWERARENIARSEYDVTWQERTGLPGLDAAYQAPNRAQDLRTYFADDGIRVVRRTEPEPKWHVGLRLASVNGSCVEQAKPVAEGNRVEYRHAGVTEWYVNDDRGLEQGFTVDRAPEGEGRLVLDLALTGDTKAYTADGGRAIEFNSPGGVRVLRYAELRAEDATGRSLPAEMRLGEGSICLAVDASRAEYPVMIDPLITMPAWTAERLIT